MYVPVKTNTATMATLHEVFFKSTNLFATDIPAKVKIGVVIDKKSTDWIACIKISDNRHINNETIETHPKTGNSRKIEIEDFFTKSDINIPIIENNHKTPYPNTVIPVTGIEFGSFKCFIS